MLETIVLASLVAYVAAYGLVESDLFAPVRLPVIEWLSQRYERVLAERSLALLACMICTGFWFGVATNLIPTGLTRLLATGGLIALLVKHVELMPWKTGEEVN